MKQGIMIKIGGQRYFWLFWLHIGFQNFN